jgi:transposase-like protein
LPLIPAGATPINRHVGVLNKGEHWTYLVGFYPVYRHRAEDLQAFRLTIAQLADSGACRPSELIKAFGISKSQMMRARRQYRENGLEGFFEKGSSSGQARRRKGRVLTDEVLARAQELIDEGLPYAAVAKELGVALDTLRRAVWDKRLRTKTSEPEQEDAQPMATDKSQRSVEDAQAAEGMGTGCTRAGERMLAAVGALDGAAIRFEACRHVPFGGVLCALGALLANGLLSPAQEHLNKISGYYSTVHILLLLAFMGLCRIKTIEQLRGKAPGEFGKLMGLDRVPEVRCLRRKLDELSGDQAAEKWAAALGREWMDADPEAAGVLYVDGHVRVYHGSKTKLPRKYVSRQRLCLRGTTDYWVNDAIGRPFFVIDKVIDSGLLAALREDIVPRLLREVPAQPSAEQLAADPHRCRLVLVYDREGYSPGFLKEMWQNHRIGCITYHKHPGELWREEEFTTQKVELPGGEIIEMKLAERGSLVGSGKDAIWVKEVRKLTESGHQVSLISTVYDMEARELAAGLFTRWCQENFFRYMMEHFEIDLLSEYRTEPLHDTEKVINPRWRELERQRGSLESKLRYRRARFAEWTLHAVDIGQEKKHQRRQRQKAELLEEIEQLEAELAKVKEAKSKTAHHIRWEELSETDRFTKPVLGRKRLMDAVRMIAYRAETAMSALLRPLGVELTDARRLLQDLFVTEADLLPNPATERLEVHVHRGSRPVVDRQLKALFEQLNEMAFTFPGTEMKMHYQLVESPHSNQKGVTGGS